MRFWFVPCESGDFRLERSGDVCVLTVENPTGDDRDRLMPFLEEATRRGWVGDPTLDTVEKLTNAFTERETIIPLSVPLSVAGPVLAGASMGALHGNVMAWTAVRYSDGQVVVVDGTELPAAPTPVQEAAPDAPAPEPVAAATAKAPKRGCPSPDAATRRASQVLQTFSTESQMEQWNREGRMTVIGNATGAAYHVYHRDEAHDRRLPRCVVDIASGEPVCVHDETIPAEEQALMMKLALEHREAWLLQLVD